jgi:hypothetical protein
MAIGSGSRIGRPIYEHPVTHFCSCHFAEPEPSKQAFEPNPVTVGVSTVMKAATEPQPSLHVQSPNKRSNEDSTYRRVESSNSWLTAYPGEWRRHLSLLYAKIQGPV